MRDVAGRFREYASLERKRAGAGLTTRELERWMQLKRALARHFSPGISDERADRRGSVRLPTRLRVSFHSEEELAESLMTNLSRGGVFVSTAQLLEIGSRLVLRIHVEETGETIEVPAEVASHNVGPDFGSQQPGMGLRFRDPSPETEKQLHDLYERALHEHARQSERGSG